MHFAFLSKFSIDSAPTELAVAWPDLRVRPEISNSACVSKRTCSSGAYLFFTAGWSSAFKSYPKTESAERWRLLTEVFTRSISPFTENVGSFSVSIVTCLI